MDATIKAKWCEALRSGEYEQGRELLKYYDTDGKIKHCCVGVLAKVLEIPETPPDSARSEIVFNFGESRAELQRYQYAPTGLNETQICKCYRMNDTECLSFNQIADYIEENF